MSSSNQRKVERRRERKIAERSPRQILAEDSIQKLMFALDNVPGGPEFDEWRKEINRAIHRIRKSGRRTPDLDVQAVRSALEKPLVYTAADVSLETDIPVREVVKILDGMISVGLVYKRPREMPEIARGQVVMLYRLTRRTSGTDDVLP